MTTQLDSSIGIAKETTYGVPVTPTKFLEFTEEDFNVEKEFASGSGQRLGRRVNAADRRVLVKESVGGSLTVEALTKGLGVLFEAALGAGVSTVASTPAYQQVFTPATTDWAPSYTIQKGIPPLGGGAVQPHTFAGNVCSGFEISAQNGGIPTFKFNFLGRSMDTTTPLAAPSYPAANQLLSFIHGTIRVGGTVVPPTNTALATGGTAVANIRDFDFTYENGLDENGFNFGGAGKRSRPNAYGLRGGTGTLVAEYDSNTLRDAYLNQSDIAIVLDFAFPTDIAVGYKPTIQVTIPLVRFDGEIPKSNGGDVITQSVPFTMLDGRAASHPIYVALVTTDTTI